jgi:hypothetical protein
LSEDGEEIESRPEGSEAESPPPAGGLRRVVLYSLLTGLCPLIPVPLLDDWVRDLLRRRLAGELAGRRGLALSGEEIKVLAYGYRPPSVEGCLRGCLTFAFVKPLVKIAVKILEKVFRKILVFLMVKESVDTFSQTFHEGYLTRHALASGALDGAPAPVARVRRAIEAAVAEQDHRPVERLARQTFRGSWRLMRQGGRRLGRLARALRRRRGPGEDDALPGELDLSGEEQVLGGVVDELTQELETETGYLRRLEALFREHLCSGNNCKPP